jgi:cysteine desulfurase
MRNVYLDNNATTQVAPEVIEAMAPFFAERWGNPSSMHAFGGTVRRDVNRAREQVAELIHADPGEIVFTGCGTESDNTALMGAMAASPVKLSLITTRVEHPAVQGPCRELKNRGATLIELGVDGSGQIRLDELRESLKFGPALVSIMWANNETGVIFPLAEIAELVKAEGGILHTDAVQAVGKVPIDVQRVPVDMLSLSGHKLHAPKGVGVLYIRKGTRLKPLLLGGHQEDSRRAGTENVPYIVGLGAAAALARAHLRQDTERIAALRDRLQAGLLQSCPDAAVNGDQRRRLPNTLNISFAYIEGEAILYSLSDAGIAASSGSACSSGSLEPSHVLRAMGIPFISVHGSIRFSLSRYTTEEEIDYVVARMPGIIERLRQLSPFVPRK